MRSKAPAVGPAIATLSAALAWADPASAQEASETTSYGERSEYQEVYEYGGGSTIYSVNIQGVIGGELVDGVAAMSRYFVAFTQEEVEQAVSGGYSYMIQNVPVTITAWSTPQVSSSWYEVVDVLTETSTSSSVLTNVTTQFTSGDAPDALVPTGYRGTCNTDGTTGATNFGASDGQFAACDYADAYLEVAPGTINTNTHTTTVYVDQFYQFQSIDDAYMDIYVVTPLASATWSTGVLQTASHSTETIRSDSYVTRLTGVVGGTTLFDETFGAAFADAAVQEGIESAQSRGYSVEGAPVVIAWSPPVLAASSEELLSTSTETETVTETSEIFTVTQTQGGAVSIGDRGTCTNAGVSGVTTGLTPTGSFADCDGGVVYVLSNGEVNTNSHITFVTASTTTTLTTEEWLNSETYLLTGVPVFIGQIHSAVRDSLYVASGTFARRHGDALANVSEPGFGLWATTFAGKTEIKSNSAGLGSSHSARGLAGGVNLGLSDVAVVGIAADYSTTDTDLAGLAETADVTHAQVGAAAEFSPGAWRLRAAAGRGWADTDSKRGEATASYGASTWFASVEAGREFAVGPVTIRPLAALEWDRVTLGRFAEIRRLRSCGRRQGLEIEGRGVGWCSRRLELRSSGGTRPPRLDRYPSREGHRWRRAQQGRRLR